MLIALQYFGSDRALFAFQRNEGTFWFFLATLLLVLLAARSALKGGEYVVMRVREACRRLYGKHDVSRSPEVEYLEKNGSREKYDVAV